MAHEAMKKLFKQIPTMKSKPSSHNKKYQLLLTDIDCVCYLTHLAAWHYFFVNQKTKIFFLVRGNLFVVCNLKYVICSVAFNGVKWVVIDVAWTSITTHFTPLNATLYLTYIKLHITTKLSLTGKKYMCL